MQVLFVNNHYLSRRKEDIKKWNDIVGIYTIEKVKRAGDGYMKTID